MVSAAREQKISPTVFRWVRVFLADRKNQVANGLNSQENPANNTICQQLSSWAENLILGNLQPGFSRFDLAHLNVRMNVPNARCP